MIFRDADDLSEPEPGFEKRLQSLEQQAEIALPGFDAQFFHRAGDLCADAREDRAVSYYGRAIDAYLRAGRYNAAGAVCRKLLGISPGAVRARCTLAWLSIGKGRLSDAQRDVDEYVRAAVAAGDADLAREQLRMMAEAIHDRSLRSLLADHLQQLDDSETAERMRADPGDRDEGEAEALWSRALRAALMGPEDLRGGD